MHQPVARMGSIISSRKSCSHDQSRNRASDVIPLMEFESPSICFRSTQHNDPTSITDKDLATQLMLEATSTNMHGPMGATPSTLKEQVVVNYTELTVEATEKGPGTVQLWADSSTTPAVADLKKETPMMEEQYTNEVGRLVEKETIEGSLLNSKVITAQVPQLENKEPENDVKMGKESNTSCRPRLKPKHRKQKYAIKLTQVVLAKKWGLLAEGQELDNQTLLQYMDTYEKPLCDCRISRSFLSDGPEENKEEGGDQENKKDFGVSQNNKKAKKTLSGAKA